MSAVVYDVGYDTRMIKTRKNMVTMWLLAATKEKKNLHKICRLPKNIKILNCTPILFIYFILFFRIQRKALGTKTIGLMVL